MPASKFPVRLLALAVLCAADVSAQAILDSPQKIEDARKLLDSFRGDEGHCDVVPVPPHFNFTLRLQAGYFARTPAGGKWVVLTRITPLRGDRSPVYLSDVVQSPPLSGAFWLGEGRYAVKWLMFDGEGHACRKQWQIDARLKPSERTIHPLVPPNIVAGVSWGAPPATAPAAPAVERLTILLHAASLQQGQTLVGIESQGILLDALMALMQELPARFVRLVIFNLDQQKEIFRTDGFTLDALPGIAKTLDQVPWAVDYHTLQNPTGPVDLVETLANQEIHAADPSGAVIFLGPHSLYSGKPSPSFGLPAGTGPRFFYLRYGNTRARSITRGTRAESWQPNLGPSTEGFPVHYPVDGTVQPNGPLPRSAAIRPNNGPDTIQYAVDQLGGTVIQVDSPDSFAGAVSQIASTLSTRAH